MDDILIVIAVNIVAFILLAIAVLIDLSPFLSL
jgi:hypothetical protein